MNPRKDAEKDLDRALEHLGRPPLEDMEAARERVRQSLRTHAGEELQLSVRSVSLWRLRQPYLIAAAAVLALAVLSISSLRNTTIDALATVESADGSFSRVSGQKTETVHPGERIEPGEILRTNGTSGTFALADGSRVEMRAGSQFNVERAEDGIRIHLFGGGLIINAAKQLAGHLYVQTKDVTVSVVGTVFLVNAEEEGSRVAVIEGEVRVQQGETTRNLLPGEQLTTNPKMEKLPVKDEVSWSNQAEVHVALLQQTVAASPTRPVPPRLKFDVVSIRPTAPGSGATGFACRGVDGVQRTNAGETGSPGFTAPQGRCVGNGVSLARLIDFAYGIPHRNGPETPDWSQPYMNPVGERPRSAATFQVEAIAENPATVTLEQHRQMLQSMLTDRFKLVFHLETQEVPVYVLGIAKGGIKFKESSGEEYLPAADFSTLSSAGGPTLRGRSKIGRLVQFVNAFINPLGFFTGELPSHVEDKTGLAGIYEYELVLPVPGGGSRGATPQSNAEDQATRSFGWRAPAMAEALEEQLGLRMLPEKVRAEVLVVDKVEKPSEN